MTDQEIVEWLESRMRTMQNYAEDEIRPPIMKRSCLQNAEHFRAAAERIRVLGEECEAWRVCPTEHFSKVWDQPQMSGAHWSEYRQKINDARAATDAARGGSR